MASIRVMTGTLVANNTLIIYVADVSFILFISLKDNEDMIEGVRMKFDDQKTIQRYKKIIDSFIYHIRTEMVFMQQKKDK